MQLQIHDGQEGAVELVPMKHSVAYVASNLSSAVCWAISGISALSHEPRLSISYGLAALALTVVSFRNRPFPREAIKLSAD